MFKFSERLVSWQVFPPPLVALVTLFIAVGFSTATPAEILVRYDPGVEDRVGGNISENPLSPDLVKNGSLATSLAVQSQVVGIYNPNTWPVYAGDGFDPGDYISFTVTAHPTVELVLDSLTWTGVSFNDSAISLTLRVSLDGFTQDVGYFESVGSAFRSWVADFDLSALPPVSGAEVEFRIYPANAGPQADFADLIGTLVGGSGLTLKGTAGQPNTSRISMPSGARATATDNGPADGVFDEIVPGNYFSWNGYTESRHAVEFDGSGFSPAIASATLRIESNGYVDGPRYLRVDGYTANGAIELADFVNENLLDSAAVDPNYEIIELDVTEFVLDKIRREEYGPGFVLRESPPCGEPLDCVSIQLGDVSLDLEFVDVLFSDSYEEEGLIRVAPTITGPGNLAIDEDTSTGPQAFHIDDDYPVGFLTVSVTSSDPVRVPAGSITLGGSGADRTIDIDPPENQFGGPVTITITVTDSQNLSSSHDFQLMINPVNDPPIVTNPSTLTSLGNVGLNVTAPLLLQATDVDGDTLTTIPGTIATTQGGSATINANGTFTYDPPAGFQGGDSFAFTVTDNAGGQAIGSATVQVSTMIWFVDASNVTSGSGTLNNPFKQLTALSAAPDQAGEVIFIRQGTYSSGHQLLNSQIVIGDGYQQPLNAILGIPLPLYSYPLPTPTGIDPVITGSGTGLTLAAGNTIRGLAIGNTTSYGIFGSNVGSLNISDSRINGTGGGFYIDSGTLSVNLEELSASAANLYGLRLEGVTGSFGIQSGTIAVSGAPAVKVESTGTLSLNVTLTSLGSSGSPSNGLKLSDTSGTFTVIGNGAAAQNGSGGTIINAVGDGISLSGVTGVSLNRMIVQGSGGNGLKGENVTNFTLNQSKFLSNGNALGEHGLNFSNNLLGSANFTSSLISGSYENGIRILNNSGTLNPLNLNGMEVRENITLGKDGLSLRVESSANVVGTVSGSTFVFNRGAGINVEGQANAVANLTVSGSTFSDGRDGVNFTGAESTQLRFNISGLNTFTRLGKLTQGRAFNLITTNNSTSGGGLFGTIDGNNISDTQHALFVNQAGMGELRLKFNNNTALFGMQQEAVFMTLGQTSPDLVAVSNLTMMSNTLGPSNESFFATVDILMRPQASACFNIRNNSITSVSGWRALDIDSTTTPGRIESLGFECGGVCPDAKTLLEASNSVTSALANNVDAMTFVSSGTCLTP